MEKNINNKTIYFLGIGGIGMSALARYFKLKGNTIYGYDKTPTSLTRQLEEEGIIIHYEEDIRFIPPYVDFVVYTPAIPKTHKEFVFFVQNNFEIYKRSEVLGMITKGTKSISVAGTHGKTTISTLISHIFKHSKYDCNAFLGGISKNYHSNLLLSEKSNFVIVEADEFDRSFLNLYPFIGIVSAIDADHLDIYGNIDELKKSFELFIDQIDKEGCLILKKGIEVNTPDNLLTLTYALNEKADFYASNIRNENGSYKFDLIYPEGIIEGLVMNYPGLHNLENAIAAVSVAVIAGISEAEIKTALSTFEGVYRRFDFRIKDNDLVYIDDYAHHPQEIRVCLESVKKLYPNKKLTAIFQPHLYSRTRDFLEEFAQSLSIPDEIILLDIYPARELPIEGVNSEILLRKICNPNKHLLSKSQLLNFIKISHIEVLVTIGAGDIDQMVEPIENLLIQKKLSIKQNNISKDNSQE
jgi:UDP-N-acetylmuramate--alanine ligase